MIITIASFKGGVAKTTTAVHLAAYLQVRSPTLLIDGDPNRSATGWSKRGQLPFKVADERQAAKYAREFEHCVIDTEARPEEEDLRALADGCDLLIIPTTPDALALDALMIDPEGTRWSFHTSLSSSLVHHPSSTQPGWRRSPFNSHGSGFATSQPRYSTPGGLSESCSRGSRVYAFDDPRASLGWEDYEEVGKEILP